MFRLAFGYRPDLVSRAGGLPHADFDRATSSWTTVVCSQSVTALRDMYYEGLTDVAVDDLLEAGEAPGPCRPAVLHAGSLRRPYQVTMAVRGDEQTYARLKSLPGAQWEKETKAVSYPPTAALALAELKARGILDDPGGVLSPAGVVIYYDSRSGRFVVQGDPRAQAAFNKYFPAQDVYARWLLKGHDVAFGDQLSEEMYRGELARSGPGLQPEGMALGLYDFQQVAAAVAVERSGLCLVMELGTGKTATAIGIGHELVVNRKIASRVVAVVPAAVETQWHREIQRFTGADDVVVVRGDKKRRARAYEAAKSARWVVLPFSQTLTSDFKEIAPLVSGAVLIADEAHRVRNHKANRSQVMRQLGARAVRRYALSGTPIDTSPGDLYGVANWMMPGILGSPVDFMNRYSFRQVFRGRPAGWKGLQNKDELRLRAKPLYVRYTMAQVAPGLPALRVSARALDPDPAYSALLKRIHKEAVTELKAAAIEHVARSRHATGVLDGQLFDDATTGAEMTATSMLRLLTSSPRLLSMSEAPAAQALVSAGLVPDQDGPKLDELRVQVADVQAAGQRVVIFTFSKRMAELIVTRLAEDGVPSVLFTGGMSRTARDKAVADFVAPPTPDDPGPTAFVATDAGGEGLNLGPRPDGGGASLLINFDLPWTPGALKQRAGRIRRIDSVAPNGFLVINYWLAGTLEYGILQLLEQRADLQDAVFGESGTKGAVIGRNDRSVFEEAMRRWQADNPTGDYDKPRNKVVGKKSPTGGQDGAGAGGQDGHETTNELSLTAGQDVQCPETVPPGEDMPGEARHGAATKERLRPVVMRTAERSPELVVSGPTQGTLW